MAKGSVMDQFTSPTVPVLHGKAGLGTEQEQSRAERRCRTELRNITHRLLMST